MPEKAGTTEDVVLQTREDGLTTRDQIAELLNEGYDRHYYESMYRQMLYAFGEPWRGQSISVGAAGSNDFPDFPDIYGKWREIGRSRRILNSEFTVMARNAFSDPDPKLTKVDAWEAEVRRQAWFNRSTGDGTAEGNWDVEMQQSILNGDGLGVGLVQIGMTPGAFGFPKVEIRDHPPVFFMWDWHAKSPSKARWCAFIHHIPKEVAAARWGYDVIKPYLKQYVGDYRARPVMILRIFEFYDLGYAGGRPTRAVIPGMMNNEPLELGPNRFGVLPFGHYQHFIASGMRRPIGRIWVQMPTQEAINEQEKRIRDAIKKGRMVDVVDAEAILPEDFEKWKKGLLTVIRSEGPLPKDVWQRHPAQEITRQDIIWWDHLIRQFDEDAGQTALERGAAFEEQKTATEVDRLVTLSAPPRAWSRKMTSRFYVRVLEKVYHMMRYGFDQAPMMLDIFGANILFNDPNDPSSAIANFMQERAEVLIDEKSLEWQDERQNRAERLLELREIAPEVAAGFIDINWYVGEKLRAIGEQDPKQRMSPMLLQGGGQMMQTLAGMPGPEGASGAAGTSEGV